MGKTAGGLMAGCVTEFDGGFSGTTGAGFAGTANDGAPAAGGVNPLGE